MTAFQDRIGQAAPAPAPDVNDLLRRVALGDEAAFAAVYDRLAPRLYGLAIRILRDRGQAEEITQEALIDIWRLAARFDPDKGSASSWALTILHRRAVDRVRTEQASAERARRTAITPVPYDQVAEDATVRLEHQQVRRCLNRLTELQREAITLAYYRGYSYREVAELLGAALPTIKTRMRDALIRLRDCLGVSLG